MKYLIYFNQKSNNNTDVIIRKRLSENLFDSWGNGTFDNGFLGQSVNISNASYPAQSQLAKYDYGFTYFGLYIAITSPPNNIGGVETRCSLLPTQLNKSYEYLIKYKIVSGDFNKRWLACDIALHDSSVNYIKSIGTTREYLNITNDGWNMLITQGTVDVSNAQTVTQWIRVGCQANSTLTYIVDDAELYEVGTYEIIPITQSTYFKKYYKFFDSNYTDFEIYTPHDNVVLDDLMIINLDDEYVPDSVKTYLNLPSVSKYIDIYNTYGNQNITSIDGITRTGTQWILYFLTPYYISTSNLPTSSQFLLRQNDIVIFEHDVYMEPSKTYVIYYYLKNEVGVVNTFIHDSQQNMINVTPTQVYTTDDGWTLYKVTYTPTTIIDGQFVIERVNNDKNYHNDVYVHGFTMLEVNDTIPDFLAPVNTIYDDDTYIDYQFKLTNDDIVVVQFTNYNTSTGTKGLVQLSDGTNVIDIGIDSSNKLYVNTNTTTLSQSLNNSNRYELQINFATSQITLVNMDTNTNVVSTSFTNNLNLNNYITVRIGNGFNIKSTIVPQIFTNLLILT